jgi:hypothetical protein
MPAMPEHIASALIAFQNAVMLHASARYQPALRKTAETMRQRRAELEAAILAALPATGS